LLRAPVAEVGDQSDLPQSTTSRAIANGRGKAQSNPKAVTSEN